MKTVLKKAASKAYFNSSVKEITENDVTLETPGGLVTIPNDWVLAMTGYHPNFNMLESFGVNTADNVKHCPVYNPDTMETNVPGLYLAGVVCGGMDTHIWFIENSRVHADKIVADIVAKHQYASTE